MQPSVPRHSRNRVSALDFTPSRIAPKMSVEQRRVEAETRASKWLADGNYALESGNSTKADKCYAKSQFWLDRANLLNNSAAKSAPKR